MRLATSDINREDTLTALTLTSLDVQNVKSPYILFIFVPTYLCFSGLTCFRYFLQYFFMKKMTVFSTKHISKSEEK